MDSRLILRPLFQAMIMGGRRGKDQRGDGFPRASAKASARRQTRELAKSRRDAEVLRDRRKSFLRPRKASRESERVRTAIRHR